MRRKLVCSFGVRTDLMARSAKNNGKIDDDFRNLSREYSQDLSMGRLGELSIHELLNWLIAYR